MVEKLQFLRDAKQGAGAKGTPIPRALCAEVWAVLDDMRLHHFTINTFKEFLHQLVVHVAAQANQAGWCAAAERSSDKAVRTGLIDVVTAGTLIVLNELGVLVRHDDSGLLVIATSAPEQALQQRVEIGRLPGELQKPFDLPRERIAHASPVGNGYEER